MITKERLEELINQDAAICNVYTDYNNICYRFGKAFIVDADNDEHHYILKVNGTNTTVIMYDTEDLYETKEDAEFALRFKRIPKTVYLDLPTWEEFKKGSQIIHFHYYPCDYECSTDLVNIYIREFFVFGGKDLYTKPLTKENYIEACELCRKLFLGEEV